MALLALLAAVGLAWSGTSSANAAWPLPDVPAGEYDIIALDPDGWLRSYDHDNDSWYDSADQVFQVTNGLIPAQTTEGYDTTGGGVRNATNDDVTITVDIVIAPIGAVITVVGDDYSWTVSDGDAAAVAVPAHYHDHFDWSFSQPGDYAIWVTAESDLRYADQVYFFTVS
ncbi:MAG: hypothetical protein LBK54_02095 [Propionibacteriaceae bacterium]|jgi:surface-anchored protein|nr:hypothetical protein [Propionibacteriaceae bacterium]